MDASTSYSSRRSLSKKRKQERLVPYIVPRVTTDDSNNSNSTIPDRLVRCITNTNANLAKVLNNLKYHTERLKYWEDVVLDDIKSNESSLEFLVIEHKREMKKQELSLSSSFEEDKRLAIEKAVDETKEKYNVLQCNICLTNDKNCVLIPCRHTFCEHCTKHMVESDKCAYCRSNVVEFVKMFLTN